MMRWRILFVFVMIVVLPTRIIAQDLHFSQYMHNALNLSPSSTGFFNGDVRANLAYRSQWNSVTVPYNTFSFSYDQSFGKIPASGERNSFGFLFNNDKAGDSHLASMQMLLSYAHLFALNDDSVYFINAGVQCGFSSKHFDINSLTFDNQFNGDVYDAMISSGENFNRTNFTFFDLNTGISLLALHGNSSYSTGVSVQHVNKPQQNFLNESVKLPMRWQFNAAATIGINDAFDINPSVIYMSQQKYRELTTGIELIIKMKEEVARRYSFGIGCHYRVNDAVIPNAAVYYNLWRLGISYDVNTSKFKEASNGRGGPEFNITYIMKKIRYSVRKNNCPVY